MSEPLPFSILTFDAFQGEYVNEDISSSYATKAEAECAAGSLLAELLAPSQSEPSANDHERDSTFSLSIVAPTGEITFFTRG